MVDIRRCFDRTKDTLSGEAKIRHARPSATLRTDRLRRESRWRTASVIPLESLSRTAIRDGIQVKGVGMDPGFHRSDDNAGMTELKAARLPVDRLECLGLQPGLFKDGDAKN